MKQTEALKLALEAMERFGEEGTAERYIKARAAIKEVLAQPEQEPVATAMTAHRAAYFMERFKNEEKLLGPNEQAAVNFVISLLEVQPEREEQLNDALNSLAFYRRRCEMLQSCQSKMRDPERTIVCDILANGRLLHGSGGEIDATRYAQPEQEPVAWMYESVCGNDFATRHKPPDYGKNIRPLYTTPPQRTWVGLTDEEILSWWSMDNDLEDLDMCNIVHFRKVIEEVEARLKRKNT